MSVCKAGVPTGSTTLDTSVWNSALDEYIPLSEEERRVEPYSSLSCHQKHTGALFAWFNVHGVLACEGEAYYSFVRETTCIVRMRLAALLCVHYVSLGFRQETFKLMCLLHRVGVLMSCGLTLVSSTEDARRLGLKPDDIRRSWDEVLAEVVSVRTAFASYARGTSSRCFPGEYRPSDGELYEAPIVVDSGRHSLTPYNVIRCVVEDLREERDEFVRLYGNDELCDGVSVSRMSDRASSGGAKAVSVLGGQRYGSTLEKRKSRRHCPFTKRNDESYARMLVNSGRYTKEELESEALW